MDNTWVTVLAGGIGSRFWPASTPERPKPLLAIGSRAPLLAETLTRARSLAPDGRIRILAGEHLVDPFTGAISDLTREHFWIEPAARGTGPVLAWAAWRARREDPDAVLVSLHADHLIEPVDAFSSLILGAAGLASREELLLTVGAIPDRPETGYGYLQPGAVVGDAGAPARRVSAFHEKPDRDTAEDYLRRGYLWNTGIFVWRASVFLDEVRRLAPEIAPALPLLEAGDEEGFFREVTPISVDVAVLERSSRVACLASTFHWDDVGTWAALGRTGEGDGAGNVVTGPGVVVEGEENLVWTDGGPVVLWGVSDLVTVHANGVTVVFPRERAPDLKRLLVALPEELKP
jgi:mannose-1-phosphate guanylyltransferase